MMFSNGKSIALVGDPIEAGGSILGSNARMDVCGVLVAHVGSPALCAVHGMTSVAEGSSSMFDHGRQLACDGDRLACGHRIVASRRARAPGPTNDTGADARNQVQSPPARVERKTQTTDAASPWILSQHLRVVHPDQQPLAGAAFIKWTQCGASLHGSLSSEGTSPPITSERPGFVHYAFEAPMAEAN